MTSQTGVTGVIVHDRIVTQRLLAIFTWLEIHQLLVQILRMLTGDLGVNRGRGITVGTMAGYTLLHDFLALGQVWLEHFNGASSLGHRH